MANPPPSKLIHVAKIQAHNQGTLYLFLRQMDPCRYIWFCQDLAGKETETPVWGVTSQEAILAAYKAWRFDDFRTLHCGFRYTLPERDEVGTEALFHQMVSSYSSSSGVYFDDELNSNCIVQLASLEARNLWTRLKT